jgi:hypothetical protein
MSMLLEFAMVLAVSKTFLRLEFCTDEATLVGSDFPIPLKVVEECSGAIMVAFLQRPLSSELRIEAAISKQKFLSF